MTTVMPASRARFAAAFVDDALLDPDGGNFQPQAFIHNGIEVFGCTKHIYQVYRIWHIR